MSGIGRFVTDDMLSLVITALYLTCKGAVHVPLVTTSLLETLENFYRIDVIGGSPLPPVIEVSNQLKARKWVKKNKKNSPNWRFYVQNPNVYKPNNTYELWKEDARFPAGYPGSRLTWIPNGDYSEYYGPVYGGIGSMPYMELTDVERENFLDMLGQKILLKIKDQKVNLAVFTAERNQAIKMFGDTLTRLGEAYRSVRRGNFKKAFDALGCNPTNRVSRFTGPANNWLQLQYGWLPLLSDMYGVSEELERTWNRALEKDAPRITKRASVVISRKETSPSIENLFQTHRREMTTKCSMWVSYTVNNEVANFLGRVGLTNPLEVAWEVVPYSFVVDWFLPVGRFLSTLDATVGCSFVGGGYSFRCDTSITSKQEGTRTEGNFLYEYFTPESTCRLFRYQRSPTSGFPAVSLPQLKNPFSVQHCANALALFTQAVRGGGLPK